MTSQKSANGLDLTEKATRGLYDPHIEGKMTNLPMLLCTKLCSVPGAAIHTGAALINVTSI